MCETNCYGLRCWQMARAMMDRYKNTISPQEVLFQRSLHISRAFLVSNLWLGITGLAGMFLVPGIY